MFVYWVDFEGQLHAWGSVEAGDVTLYHTWAGHAWEARSAGRRCRYVLPLEGEDHDVRADVSAALGNIFP